MSKLKEQNYNNHRRFSVIYHFFLSNFAPIVVIASIVYLILERFSYASILLLAISINVMILVIYVRKYATKLQDRIIRSEENSRHIILTGKPLDSKLTLKQIIALRFAEDEAFPQLCKIAAETGMEQDAIKKSISNWRADHHRV